MIVPGSRGSQPPAAVERSIVQAPFGQYSAVLAYAMSKSTYGKPGLGR